MKHEIEVKAKVDDKEALISKLKELGCILSEPITQDDYVYNFKGINLNDHSHDTPTLRVRVQGGKNIFTLKKDITGELDCLEKEVEITEKETMLEIMELLGYVKTVEVHKKRQKGKYGDWVICVDEVDVLGTFIEVEKMSDEDGDKVQDELFEFLLGLGIKKEDRAHFGYDTLLWKKHNQK